jgi:uroporphyrinogen-III decarboxylase
MPTNGEKQRVWDAYRARRPERVPVTLGVNPRVVLFDPRWNPEGVSFQQYWEDAETTIRMQLRFMDYKSEFLSRFCDSPAGTPQSLEFYVDLQNVWDALYFGCPLRFRDEQVPDTEPILAGDGRDRIFDFDIDHPLDNPFVQDVLRRHEALVAAAAKVDVPGVALSVRPPLMGFDGHLTVATNLRGHELYLDIYEDPDYVRRLLSLIHQATVNRTRALHERFGRKAFDGRCGGLPDDSIQLISTETHREFVLPCHRAWLGLWSEEGHHWTHLCGDASRHFPIMQRELNVQSFDTGFPIDLGRTRRELGPEAEIAGGVEVGLLLGGTPEQVYARTREILGSGVMKGGRFILREANNLPPRVPEANLQAMYDCCLEHGRYD